MHPIAKLVLIDDAAGRAGTMIVIKLSVNYDDMEFDKAAMFSPLSPVVLVGAVLGAEREFADAVLQVSSRRGI